MTFTAKTADPSAHTLEWITKTVSVREFRALTDHLARKVRVDFHACKGAKERARWVEETRRIAKMVREAGCKRAKVEDWDRRENALDSSATYIIRALNTPERRSPPELRVISGGLG